MDWNTTRKTPKEIVDRIGNIANRSDIQDTKDIQVKEIREYAASELEKFALALSSIALLDGDDPTFNYIVGEVAQTILARSQAIREGQ